MSGKGPPRDPTKVPNLGTVEEGVYRGGFPTALSFDVLLQLRIKTIINLRDVWPEDYVAFTKANNISFLNFSVKGNKQTPEDMDNDRIARAIALILDTRAHPVLVHCRSGKHRTGSLIGVLRKLLMWDEEAVMEEYVEYSTPKERALDMEYIRRFDLTQILPHLPEEGCIPLWARSGVVSLKSLATVEQSSSAKLGDESKRDWRLGVTGDPFKNLDRDTEDAKWYPGLLVSRNPSSASPASASVREEKDSSDCDPPSQRNGDILNPSQRLRTRSGSTTSSSSSGDDPEGMKEEQGFWLDTTTIVKGSSSRSDMSPPLLVHHG